MILGIGTDICAIERVAGAIERQGDRFLARVFTVAEQNAARLRPEPALYFARRFAAKEACVKALGTGITGRVRWTDIEILSEPSGRPVLTLSGGALRRARRLAPRNYVCITHVSLSDEIDKALAFVVIEARETTV